MPYILNLSDGGPVFHLSFSKQKHCLFLMISFYKVEIIRAIPKILHTNQNADV
jgi:hypothetical protein